MEHIGPQYQGRIIQDLYSTFNSLKAYGSKASITVTLTLGILYVQYASIMMLYLIGVTSENAIILLIRRASVSLARLPTKV